MSKKNIIFLIISILPFIFISCPGDIEDVNIEEAVYSGIDYSFVIWRDEIPQQIPAGRSLTVPVVLLNNGNKPWISTPERPFYLSYHWKHPGGRFNSDMFWGARTPLPEKIGAGEMVTIDFTIIAPEVTKYYDMTIDIIRGLGKDRDSVYWFEEHGWHTVNYRLEVVE